MARRGQFDILRDRLSDQGFVREVWAYAKNEKNKNVSYLGQHEAVCGDTGAD